MEGRREMGAPGGHSSIVFGGPEPIGRQHQPYPTHRPSPSSANQYSHRAQAGQPHPGFLPGEPASSRMPTASGPPSARPPVGGGLGDHNPTGTATKQGIFLATGRAASGGAITRPSGAVTKRDVIWEQKRKAFMEKKKLRKEIFAQQQHHGRHVQQFPAADSCYERQTSQPWPSQQTGAQTQHGGQQQVQQHGQEQGFNQSQYQGKGRWQQQQQPSHYHHPQEPLPQYRDSEHPKTGEPYGQPHGGYTEAQSYRRAPASGGRYHQTHPYPAPSSSEHRQTDSQAYSQPPPSSGYVEHQHHSFRNGHHHPDPKSYQQSVPSPRAGAGYEQAQGGYYKETQHQYQYQQYQQRGGYQDTQQHGAQSTFGGNGYVGAQGPAAFEVGASVYHPHQHQQDAPQPEGRYPSNSGAPVQRSPPREMGPGDAMRSLQEYSRGPPSPLSELMAQGGQHQHQHLVPPAMSGRAGYDMSRSAYHGPENGGGGVGARPGSGRRVSTGESIAYGNSGMQSQPHQYQQQGSSRRGAASGGGASQISFG